jgi:hypothetical protein
MLWKEHAVRVIGPTRASAPNFIGPEALRKVSAGYRAADVFDEPAHEASVASMKPALHPRRRPIARRHLRIFVRDQIRVGVLEFDAPATITAGRPVTAGQAQTTDLVWPDPDEECWRR